MESDYYEYKFNYKHWDIEFSDDSAYVKAQQKLNE